MSAAAYYHLWAADPRWRALCMDDAKRIAEHYADRPDAFVYRTEIVNRSVHPIRAGQSLQAGEFDSCWGCALEEIAPMGSGYALVMPYAVRKIVNQSEESLTITALRHGARQLWTKQP